MRTLLSTLVVAALLALAGVAALDAVRGDDPEPAPVVAPAPAPPELEQPPGGQAAVTALRGAGATGQLVYADETCRGVALRLPELEREQAARPLPCPAEQEGGGWTLVEPATTIVLPQCVPGEQPPSASCRTAVLSPQEVRRAFGGRAVIVTEAAWLGGPRLAAVVRDTRRRVDLLAIFADGRLVGEPSLAAGELSGVGVSPRRTHVAVRVGAGGLYVLDRDGRFALPGRFRFQLLDTRAVTWSPDGAWTALATRRRVFLLETDPRAGHVVALPIEARALDWR